MIRLLFITLSFWLLTSPAFARQSLPLDTGNTEISLISDHDTIVPGQSFTVALRMKFDGEWYSYWRNAGDSGEPVVIAWDLPQGFTAGPIQWPAPKVKTVGPIVSYSLGKDQSGEVWLPVNISVDESASAAAAVVLKAHVYFLVCDVFCVPEDGALSLPMGMSAGSDALAEINENHARQVDTAKSKIPLLSSAKGSAVLNAGKVEFNISNLPAGFETAELFPNENPIIAHSNPVNRLPAERGTRYMATPGYGWDDGVPESFEATLVNADGDAIIVPVATDTVVDIGAVNVSASSSVSKLGFWGAALGAFLGGLILNLMPCVFPIISLKALSLTKTAHGERGAIRRSAWAYTAGVLVSFAVFALILIAVKLAGGSVGWGFQLQSPWLVALLALLLFAIGLNLLGVFELSGRFQNVGSGAVHRAGPFSSFLTGVLAVIVATPCTAPFMAGAVGYALASPALTTLVVFLALGLGFALPFLLVAYLPGLLSRLPKPGPWMETFRQFLAFPMFAAAIWLTWVLNLQAGANGMAVLLFAGLALAFGIWALSKSRKLAKAVGIAALIAAVILPFNIKSAYSTDTAAALNAKDWSAQAVAMAQEEGRPVFVDFTAAWCVTCKVNETLVLKTKKIAELFERTDTEVLIADWTNKDDVIAAELRRFGRAGVPLYLLYRPGETEPEILPQTLSYGVLEAALE